jgi:hypothetical protein
MRNVSGNSGRGYQNTFLSSETFFFWNLTLMRKCVKIFYSRAGHMKIWRRCIACWIPKATNTHSEYVIPFAFPLQQWLHEGASTLRYMYIAFHICFSNWQRLLRAGH